MERIRCIICETEWKEKQMYCTRCGFQRQLPRFLSENQYLNWVEQTVNPYRREWMENEARERAEQEAKEQAEREAKERAEQEAREQVEREKKERAKQKEKERKARERAEREAKKRAEQEAKEQAEREKKEREEQEAKERAKQEETEKRSRLEWQKRMLKDSSFCGTFGLDFFVRVGEDKGVYLSSNSSFLKEVDRWDNIIAVAAGYFHILGLKEDGSVVAAGRNTFGQCAVKGWKNIVQIAAAGDCSATLDKDGNVHMSGDMETDMREAETWKDITKIALGNRHILGLCKDGTVRAAGTNQDEQCENVSRWNHIKDIAVGEYHSLGLKEDGTVVASGSNIDGECDVEDWIDICRIQAVSGVSVGIDTDGEVWAAGQFGGGFEGIQAKNIILGEKDSDYLAVTWDEHGEHGELVGRAGEIHWKLW